MLASVPKDLFGGGTRAGISIQPVGFLVVQNGDVRLLQMTEGNGDTANNLIRTRSEERRVGKECRSRWSPYH